MMMMIRNELIYIDNWYPWGNALIIGDRKRTISDKVNNKLYNILEANAFPEEGKEGGMPTGPFDIEISRLMIKGSYCEVITDITFKGVRKLRTTMQKNVRKLIVKDRTNAKKWISYIKEQRKEEWEQNITVGDIKVINSVTNGDKTLQ